MNYQSAAGHDNVVGLTTLTYQPACEGLNYSLWTPTSHGNEPVGGQLAQIVYKGQIDESWFPTILTQLGLSSANNAERTMTLPRDDRSAGNFNVIISRPKKLNYSGGFYHNLSFEVRVIEEV